MNNVLSNILRFVIVLVLQVFICSNIHLFGFATPALYLLALLLLPLELPKSVQYLIGFAAGFVVDLFAYTLGVNMAASLIVMFVRPYLVKLLNGRNTTEGVDRPIPGVKDTKWMFTYVIVLSFLHQFFVVMLEACSFRHFGYSLMAIVADSVFTAFVLLCVLYIFYPARKTR